MEYPREHRPPRALAVVTVLGGLACAAGTVADDGRTDQLMVMQDDHPRAFFFRQSEALAANKNVPYSRWEETFGRLMGIEGKVLDEEIVGRSARNIELFTRFKQRHPNQLVLLHFNGNARDPRWESDRFFAGHWLYYNGARIVSDVPAETGVTEIKVADPRLFRVKMGRYRDKNEDIGLCVLDAEGKPDWSRSEQVQLVSIDPKNKAIHVRRGCFGTTPRAFAAGQSYAAAHMTEGPWGRTNHLLWFYNYATCCPRDRQGRRCADVLAAHLTELFGDGGALAAFDGLEFDVLHHQCAGGGQRGADCDADGRIDRGRHAGVNAYGLGVVEFCRQLRGKLGEDRLILADGMGEGNQRAFGILNGIESEGWPHLRDDAVRDWSGGLNRHFFWRQNARPPTFNYINHKYRTPGDIPGRPRRTNVPFSTNRLVFAVAAFTDAAVCFSDAPASEPGGMLGIWDELRMGTENRLGWLGKPLGPPVRLAAAQPEILELGAPVIERELAARFAGRDVRFTVEDAVLRIEPGDASVGQTQFVLEDVPCAGPDLTVFVTARGAALRGYSFEVARMMHVVAAPQGQKATRASRFMTWVGGRDFESSFYFGGLESKRVDLHFTIEGGTPVWISRLAVHAHPDVMYRRFEHGIVLANPSPRPYAFNLARLAPGRRFRRLRGSPWQDPDTNNASAVAGEVTLGPKDALFLAADGTTD